MSIITTKFQGILLSGFRGVALRGKTGLTDCQTDGRTDGSKTLYLPQLVAWGIINVSINKSNTVVFRTITMRLVNDMQVATFYPVTL